nr:hypothetical protein CFP56_32272 [Quercus suber]
MVSIISCIAKVWNWISCTASRSSHETPTDGETYDVSQSGRFWVASMAWNWISIVLCCRFGFFRGSLRHALRHVTTSEIKVASSSLIPPVSFCLRMTFYQSIPWHSGEERMRETLHVPVDDNPTVPALSPQLSRHLQIAPLIAVGTLDSQNKPWTTLWGGHKGLAQALGGNVLGIKSQVTSRYDPVVEELVGKEVGGGVQKEHGQGRMVSGLTLDLNTRKRVKFYGRMVAGALGPTKNGGDQEDGAEVQLVLKIEQSLGNCPKYLNSKTLEPAISTPELLYSGPRLSQRGLDLVANADLFFISSSNNNEDMDTNHRGGPAGFIRTVTDNPSGTVLYMPEYSGNRLYQTLGNLVVNPLAGLCIPDFVSGDVLYLSGSSEILIAEAATEVLPRSNLVVKLTVTDSRYVASALPFRGTPGESSPYNPTVRYLATERPSATSLHQKQDPTAPGQTATLVAQNKLNPTISRYKFKLTPPSRKPLWSPGQYVTLDFSDHLDLGYSHMRDDNPRSINDDFLRTFTVSNRPDSSSPSDQSSTAEGKSKETIFEITIRNVGAVTNFLSRFNARESLDLGVKGFGGEFCVSQSASAADNLSAQQEDRDVAVTFIAAGVGITPLLPSLVDLQLDKLRVLWSVRVADVDLVLDVLAQQAGLAQRLEVFLTGSAESEEAGDRAADRLREYADLQVWRRRVEKEDVARDSFGEHLQKRFYICTGDKMRRELLHWLEGEEVVFEDFNF